jgi:hypothetical protein
MAMQEPSGLPVEGTITDEGTGYDRAGAALRGLRSGRQDRMRHPGDPTSEVILFTLAADLGWDLEIAREEAGGALALAARIAEAARAVQAEEGRA